jgi:hypothetical protein
MIYQISKKIKYWADLLLFDRKTPIIGGLGGDMSLLLYAANPVYIDVSQGRSPLVDKALMLFLIIFVLILVGTMPFLISFKFGLTFFSHCYSIGDYLLASFNIFMFWFIEIFSIFMISCFCRSFFAPLDDIVRFDRKRQTVYINATKREKLENISSIKNLFLMWQDKRKFIEIPWNKLYPAIFAHANPYLQGRSYSCLFIEPDETQLSKKSKRAYKDKDGFQHSARIGFTAQGGTTVSINALVLPALPLEAIRRFMEDGYQPWMRPSAWRRIFRPDWRYIFTFHHPAEQRGLDKEKNIGWKLLDLIVNAVVIPLSLFPMLFYWISTRVAPVPKFPQNIVERNQNDLKELGIDEFGDKIDIDKIPAQHNFKNKFTAFWVLDKLLAVFCVALALLAVASIPSTYFLTSPSMKPVIEFTGISSVLFYLWYFPFLASLCVAFLSANSIWLMKKANPAASPWLPAKPIDKPKPEYKTVKIRGLDIPVFDIPEDQEFNQTPETTPTASVSEEEQQKTHKPNKRFVYKKKKKSM